jgi:hypothetical protein
MKDFTKLLKINENTKFNRFWYVSGTVPALVRDAVEHIKSYSGVFSGFVSMSTFSGNTATIADIVCDINRITWKPRKMIILYDAEDFNDWGELNQYLETTDQSLIFIAVSPVYVNSDSKYRKASDEDRFYLFTGGRGSHISCNKFSSLSDTDKWISSYVAVDEPTRQELVGRFHNDYEWFTNTLKKLSYIPVETVTIDIFNKFIFDHGIYPIEHSLLNFEKKDLILALDRENLSLGDVPKLVEKIRVVALIQSIPENNKSLKKVPDILKQNISQKELKEIKMYKGNFDLNTVKRCSYWLSKVSNNQLSESIGKFALAAGW